MKKLIILLALLIIPSICQAEILDNFKEMRYRLESGVNFRDFNTAYQQLYIDYRKTNDPKYKDLMDLYTGLKQIWANRIDNIYDVQVENRFVAKYPDNQCYTIRGMLIGDITCATLKWSEKLEKQ